MKTLSLVIPAYNEEARLPTTLRHIRDFVARTDVPFSLLEVIVSDDGSTDRTAEIAHSFEGELPIRVLQFLRNRGKGAVVRDGMLSAKGDIALFYDADGATPIHEIVSIINVMNKQDADVVIGSRTQYKQNFKHVSLTRKLTGKIFHVLCKPLLPNIDDASCGCKAFTRAAVVNIFSEETLQRYAFDIELLLRAKIAHMTICEVPVQWDSIPQSKVRVFRDGCTMFLDVLSLYAGRIKAIFNSGTTR